MGGPWAWGQTPDYRVARIEFTKEKLTVVYHRRDGWDAIMQWEHFPDPIAPTVVGMCPRCTSPDEQRLVLFQKGNRDFAVEAGLLSVLEQFGCDHCKARYRLNANRMVDT
jgi:hypothetical protein